LSDIYLDIKRGLILFDGHHPIDAAWEWRFNFQIHWGQHLVGAQRTQLNKSLDASGGSMFRIITGRVMLD